jgi:hypothetical protein
MIDALMMISMNILEFLEAHVSQIVKLRLYVLHHLSLRSGLPRGTILFTVALFSGLPLGVLFRTIQGGDRKGSRFQRKSTVKPRLGNDDFLDDVREDNRARVLPFIAEFMFT